MKTSAFALSLLAAAAPAFATMVVNTTDVTTAINDNTTADNTSVTHSVTDNSSMEYSNNYAPAYEYSDISGQECNVASLIEQGFNVTETCCQSDDKSFCGSNNHCRIKENDEQQNVKCACAAAPAEKDICDDDLLFPITKECANGTASCRVKTVDADYNVECEAVVVPAGVNCGGDGYAYDSCNYCRCPAPQPAADGSGTDVSVCGDATYTVQTNATHGICGGDGDEPSGKLCPQQGDVATDHCRKEVWSYGLVKEGECTAPETAECMKLKGGNTWGCVFPTNCNTKTSCLDKNVCNDNYAKVNGTDICQMTPAGFPIQANTSSPNYINTTATAAPASTTEFSTKAGSFAAITNVLSLIVGMFTTALTIFASA